ncbi:MAG: hypothetical protein H6648_07735 [Caldilineae bacterium]|nr:hypothetical protein [Caldilineae bacterium]
MSTRQVEVLNEALERVERGQRPEQVLAEMSGAYDPADLRQLALLLAAALALREEVQPGLKPVSRQHMRRELEALASAQASGRRMGWLGGLFGLRPGRALSAPLFLRALPLTLALIFSLGSVMVISADSQRGDLLYPLQPISRSVLSALERVVQPVLDGRRATRNRPRDGAARSVGDGALPLATPFEDPPDAGERPGGRVGRPTAVERKRTASLAVTAIATARPTNPVPAAGPARRVPLQSATQPPTAIPASAAEDPPRPRPEPEPETTQSPMPSPSSRPIATPTGAGGVPSPTATAAGPVCGGMVRGRLLGVDGEPYNGPQPVTILASMDGSPAPEVRLGATRSVDGAYALELDSRVCQGQVESFYVVAYDLDAGVLRGFHGDLAVGPSSLSVMFRAAWDEVPVTVFVDIEPIEPSCPVDAQIGQVSGQVLDSATGPPVPFAFVGLVDQGPQADHRWAPTDDDGRYRIDSACPGFYQVQVFPENGAAGQPWGFWDPNGDGEPDILEISIDAPSHSNIDVIADVPGWP